MIYYIHFPKKDPGCYHNCHHDVASEIKEGKKARIIYCDQFNSCDVLF